MMVVMMVAMLVVTMDLMMVVMMVVNLDKMMVVMTVEMKALKLVA